MHSPIKQVLILLIHNKCHSKSTGTDIIFLRELNKKISRQVYSAIVLLYRRKDISDSHKLFLPFFLK